METAKLKKFAQYARRQLMEQVTAKLKLVLAQESPARRERPEAVAKLEDQIKRQGEAQVVERVAYTWFNRFCALRFMDVNGYNRIGVVSPAVGQFQPEILAEAKMGYVDEAVVPAQTRQQILALLDGTASSPEPQAEAYRLLVVAVCNDYHRIMPYLFERIDDYTELLMPDDLLSGNSILAYTREAMTPDACEDVEVIGWLYQFYISEKKDEVFAALKKNKKITPENIPAATQLFTPNWIVRYLVENSLGRLWLLNRPDSKLVEQMEYYIKPEQAETDFLKVGSPEELKICDPACGSGHMLTYAFDLLYAIYEEEGYEPAEIPEKILTHNLHGVEIDERAGELAAFALTMKAREKQRRFFRKPVQPNICVLESVSFEDGELKDYLDFVGRDLFTEPLRETLHQFREADNFGSLIRPAMTDVGDVLALLKEKDVAGQLFLYQTHQKVLKVLRQADFLSSKYHVVVANPPYMGGRNMNASLKEFLKREYTEVRTDVFAAFIVRNTELACSQGQLGFMSPFVWMFLSSYEQLRKFILNKKGITSLVQLEYSGFDGATVPICTFTLENAYQPKLCGGYIRLSEFKGAANQGPRTLEAIANRDCGWFFHATSHDFAQIPGSPIAYWVSDRLRRLFSELRKAEDASTAAVGLQTGDNDRFMRFWHEVSYQRIGFGFTNTSDTKNASEKWVPYNKGGAYRKWFGNREYIVNWKNDGVEIRSIVPKSVIRNERTYFKVSITWSEITSSWKSFRYIPGGSIHDVKGQSAFFDSEDHAMCALAWLNSNVVEYLTKVLNPTLSFQSGDYRNLPMPEFDDGIVSLARRCVELAQNDWDTFETSWSFQCSPLPCNGSLEKAYDDLRRQGHAITTELHELETQINNGFIARYQLRDDIRNEITSEQLTLDANPYYRYGSNKTEEELEALLLADTTKEFISYAVGCMFGRYALDKPGLILANQGETIEDYRKLVPNSTFPADEDNVIPMLDGDWFPDDIAERFRKFLRVTFGEEHYAENLKFLENAIGKDIRKYFLRDFYTDHLKRYKKRPIYWLFSSPKGTFNALIYMHRYRPDTVSVVLNDYLREFRTKLTAEKSHQERVSISASASASDKTKALRQIENLNKMIEELEDYEREVLYPLATEQVEIDLDDGVKVNYGKFGKALKKVSGLN